MAGIEKVCEYSGDYPGSDMYRIKRNHIQIMPEYRRLFRYQPHVLFWLTPEPKWVHRWGGVSDYEPSRIDFYTPPFKTVAEYEQHCGLRRVGKSARILVRVICSDVAWAGRWTIC